MKRQPLISFFLITFVITWGIAALFFLFPEQLITLTGKAVDRYHPLFVLAVWAPSLSAFLVILRVRGKQGLLAFWARYLDIATDFRWYLLGFVGIIGFGLCLRYLNLLWGVEVPQLSFSWYTFIPFAAYWLISDPGPLGEEGGWRGFALPLLQRHVSPFLTSLILGTVWSLWHLPAFYVSTLGQSNFLLPLFMFSNIALTMFMTYAYNATRGNLPLMIVIHWAINLAGVFVSLANGAFFVATGFLFLITTLLLSCLRPARPMVDPIPGWSEYIHNSPQAIAKAVHS